MKTASKMQQTEKIGYLDGMRGMMSLNVIICHFVTIFFPQMYLAANADEGALSIFGSTPLNVLVNGNIAVCYFFVLTGFLCARTVFIKNCDLHTMRVKFVDRYLRFLPMVITASGFVFLSMKLGLQWHKELIGIPGVDAEFLESVCNFDGGIGTFLQNCFVKTFTDSNDYIIPYWSIRYEFWGYIAATLVAYFLQDSKYRRIIYIAFIMAVPTAYNSILLGVLVADFIFNRKETVFSDKIPEFSKSKIFLFVAGVIGLYCACCPMTLESVYSFWKFIPKEEYDVAKFLRSVGMALMVYVMYHSKTLQKIIENPVNMFLGKISFSTYSFHFPIMISVEAFVFLKLLPIFGYFKAAWFSLAITFPIIILVSYISWVIVEKRLVINLCKIKNASAITINRLLKILHTAGIHNRET